MTPLGEPSPPGAAPERARPASDIDVERLHTRVAELERELARLRARDTNWRTERQRLLAALDAAESEVSELTSLRHEVKETRDAVYWLAVAQSSRAWRMAAPFRAARRAAQRVLRRGA
jgi:predicted  nucleic acid-binding Zn-ribbon protein